MSEWYDMQFKWEILRDQQMDLLEKTSQSELLKLQNNSAWLFTSVTARCLLPHKRSYVSTGNGNWLAIGFYGKISNQGQKIKSLTFLTISHVWVFISLIGTYFSTMTNFSAFSSFFYWWKWTFIVLDGTTTSLFWPLWNWYLVLHTGKQFFNERQEFS